MTLNVPVFLLGILPYVSLQASPHSTPTLQLAPQEWRLKLEGIGWFRATGGERLEWQRWDDSVSDRDIRTFAVTSGLGALAILGGGLLVALTVINQAVTRRPSARAGMAGMQAEAESDRLRLEAEMVQAMGMRDAAFDRWQQTRNAALSEQMRAADLGGSFANGRFVPWKCPQVFKYITDF